MDDEDGALPFARKTTQNQQNLQFFQKSSNDAFSSSEINVSNNDNAASPQKSLNQQTSSNSTPQPMTTFQQAFSSVLADPEYKKRHENLVNLLAEQGKVTPTPTIETPSTIPLQPLPQAPRQGTNTIIANKVQRGNPVLDHIKNVPWEFGETLVDYQVGATSGVLFLSLKYHRLHPDYIIARLKKIQGQYLLRILLVRVDIDDHQATLRELHRISFQYNITLILTWSTEEAARYLETFKAYEHKPPDMIRQPKETGGDLYMNRLTDVLTQIKSVTKTDVVTMASNLGSFKDIVHADQDTFRLLNGFGEAKAKRVYEAFRQPFKIDKAAQKRSRDQAAASPPS